MPMQQVQGVQIHGRTEHEFATLTEDGSKQRIDVSSGYSSLPGLNISPFDRIDATYPSTTQEVYAYSLSGITHTTVTVNYVDATKQQFTSVIKT